MDNKTSKPTLAELKVCKVSVESLSAQFVTRFNSERDVSFFSDVPRNIKILSDSVVHSVVETRQTCGLLIDSCYPHSRVCVSLFVDSASFVMSFGQSILNSWCSVAGNGLDPVDSTELCRVQRVPVLPLHTSASDIRNKSYELVSDSVSCPLSSCFLSLSQLSATLIAILWRFPIVFKTAVISCRNSNSTYWNGERRTEELSQKNSLVSDPPWLFHPTWQNWWILRMCSTLTRKTTQDTWHCFSPVPMCSSRHSQFQDQFSWWVISNALQRDTRVCFIKQRQKAESVWILVVELSQNTGVMILLLLWVSWYPGVVTPFNHMTLDQTWGSATQPWLW